MLSKGTHWVSRFEHTPGTVSGLIGRFVHDVYSQLIHHDHIALCQYLVGYIGIEGTFHLGQLSLDLRGLVPVALACYLHLLHKLIFWEREDGIQCMHQVHAAIEHDEPPMCQASSQAIISTLLHCFMILPRDISKRKH